MRPPYMTKGTISAAAGAVATAGVSCAQGRASSSMSAAQAARAAAYMGARRRFFASAAASSTRSPPTSPTARNRSYAFI